MSSIKIKHFGPIKEGYQENEGWLEIRKVTVFIGNQGSGKSTVAKLISTLMWIEKNLVRGSLDTKNLTHKRFKKECDYQNIGSYFKEETYIAYKGKAYNLVYENEKVTIEKNENNGFLFPKIMYIPAERNFVSSVRNVNSLKGLPKTLYTFSEEFLNATEELKGQLALPINQTKFEYQKLNKLSWIVGEDYKIKLSESSSGFQSFVPLFMVTQYLAESLKGKEDNSVSEMSIEEAKRLRKEIEKILSNPNLSEEVKQSSLAFLSAKFSYAAFINVVEEPEQNLFPPSQREMLNMLLKYANMTKGNKLIMTTHSPYIITYLTLAVKANQLVNKITDKNGKEKVNEIVPLFACVNANELGIFELEEKKGSIRKLGNYEGIPSDDNFLNYNLGLGNALYDALLAIEEELCV